MRVLLTLLLFLFAAAPVCADETQDQIVSGAEAYLNGITTVKAQFEQVDNEGKTMTGTFLLKRPGRMRIDYDAPSTDFIVADGRMIYYYDGQMRQQSSTLISRSLADFFLRKELKLSGDISVSDVRREKDKVALTLTQTSNPLAGSLSLVMQTNPWHLLEWTVVDGQGSVTQVRLLGSTEGIALKDKFFHYYDPEHKKESYQE